MEASPHEKNVCPMLDKTYYLFLFKLIQMISLSAAFKR